MFLPVTNETLFLEQPDYVPRPLGGSVCCLQDSGTTCEAWKYPLHLGHCIQLRNSSVHMKSEAICKIMTLLLISATIRR